jgi:hypothetical protein
VETPTTPPTSSSAAQPASTRRRLPGRLARVASRPFFVRL